MSGEEKFTHNNTDETIFWIDRMVTKAEYVKQVIAREEAGVPYTLEEKTELYGLMFDGMVDSLKRQQGKMSQSNYDQAVTARNNRQAEILRAMQIRLGII